MSSDKKGEETRAQPGNGSTKQGPDLKGGHRSIFEQMADKLGMNIEEFRSTLATRIMRSNKDGQAPTQSAVAACLVVAREYDLNPITGEVSFFFDQWKNLVSVVPIDGWLTIINRHPQFDGLDAEAEFAEEDGGKNLIAYRCTIHRKDRSRPTTVTEYLGECLRDTGPWNSHPSRMLRHKSIIQCARVAFGFVGIIDDDELGRMIEVQTADAGIVHATSGQQALEAHREDSTIEDILSQANAPEEPVRVEVPAASGAGGATSGTPVDSAPGARSARASPALRLPPIKF